MMWQVIFVRPTKGVLRAHGKKRRETVGLGMPHRQIIALHTTRGGVGVVGQLRENHHRRKRIHEKA